MQSQICHSYGNDLDRLNENFLLCNFNLLSDQIYKSNFYSPHQASQPALFNFNAITAKPKDANV